MLLGASLRRVVSCFGVYPGTRKPATAVAAVLGSCPRPSRSPPLYSLTVSGSASHGGGRGEGMPPKPKFYAVKKGRAPGIYTSWNDCKAQVDQFSGAVHHGFKTLAEAQSWLATGPQQQEDRGSGGASAGGAGPAATPAPDGTQQSYYARIVAEEVALHAERRRQARETGVLPPDPAAVKAAEEAYERRQAENAAASSAFDALLSEEIGMHRGSRIPASEASGAGAGAAAGRSAVEPEEAARGDGAAGSGSPMGIGGAGAAAAEPAKRKRGRPKKKSADEGDAAASGSSDESSEGAESPEGAAKKKAAKAARAPPKGARKVAAEAAAAVPAAAAAASTNPEHAELPEDLAFALAEAFADDEGERQRKPEGTWLVRFDGGSRGNPGPAGCAAVIYDAAQPGADVAPVASAGVYVGLTTNNVAEYQGLITGLEMALIMGIEDIVVEGDSDLIIKQVTGVYKCRHQDLQPLNQKAVNLSKRFKSCVFRHIYREFNKAADAAANQVMDTRTSFRRFPQGR